MFYAFFVQKSFLTRNYFLTAEINLTTRGPLHTCLVFMWPGEAGLDFHKINLTKFEVVKKKC